jgi:hypothetical protein
MHFPLQVRPRHVARASSLICLVVLISVVLLGSACHQRNLRGSFAASQDGQTYLAIVDDNGGNCRSVRIDGQPWLHRVGEAGQISPGDHTISCNGDISFNIPSGVVYKFDYWGP